MRIAPFGERCRCTDRRRTSGHSHREERDSMQLGMIGLGRMGANMARRLLRAGHECVVYDRSPKAVEDLAEEKAAGSSSIGDLIKQLKKLRAVWLMVPAAVVTTPSPTCCPTL